MSVEDVRADPTGPELADASGRRDEQDQPRLARARVEQRSQLPDVAQIGELPRAARGCARRCSPASFEALGVPLSRRAVFASGPGLAGVRSNFGSLTRALH